MQGGVFIWPDGACYEGFWKDNFAHGRLKFTHIDGNVYEGNWINDKAIGRILVDPEQQPQATRVPNEVSYVVGEGV